MAKKSWAEEERKAFGEKMKAARQNKNPKPTEDKKVSVLEKPEEVEVTISSSELDELRQQIKELKDMQWNSMVSQAREVGPAASVAGGKLTGTFEKYTLNADKYPSPVERLTAEPRLKRFAFDINYELDYTVSVSEYTTIDGIRTKEPKFQLELIVVMMDDDTGEPTTGRYTHSIFVMHEDPEAALVIARDNGLEIEAEDEKTFLNEMRYLRMKDWLLTRFYPAPRTVVNQRVDKVINGKLVQYFESKSPDAVVIDFSKIKKTKF